MLMSKVPNHEGPCRAVWLNQNQVHHRLDGGVMGFFRLVRRGPWLWPVWLAYGSEFHGIIRGRSGVVVSTKEVATSARRGVGPFVAFARPR